MNVSVTVENRKKMEFFVDNCELKTPEEVARLFTEYTILIWDDFLIGKIYDFYDDDVKMNHANGVVVQGIANVFAGTLAGCADTLRKMPGKRDMFVDIFAEGNPEDGWRFIQATTAYDADKGPYAVPEGRVYGDDFNGKVGLCECLVKKVNGRWQIVEEWLVRAPYRQPT